MNPTRKIVIHIDPPPPRTPEPHRHRWAWCQRVDGAEVQRCYDCGAAR